MASSSSRLLVVAIDFGTTYSGYAFSFKSDPTAIKTNQSWSKSLVSMKTPTVVLVDRDRKFYAFGYEAEEKYSQLLEDGEAEGWALFRRFKMFLYKNPDLYKDLEITDLSGKVKMRALTAFSMSIKYLKNHALASLSERQASGIRESDIHFVITVPAIWDDRARLFMREATAAAGIPTDQFSLALESEAASVWCQSIPLAIASDGDTYDIRTVGSKYMVVDIGGGTVDITVHQKLKNGRLREVYKANGGNWGGTQVDKAFIQSLRDVLGEETMKTFQEECLNDVFDLLKEFETTKRAINPDTTSAVKVRLPISLQMIKVEENQMQMKGSVLRQQLLKTLMSTNFGEKLTVKDGRMRIDPELAKAMFEYPVSHICDHMRELMCNPDVGDVETIIVVGGFSECSIVQHALKSQFPTKRVVFPQEPGLTVLKGAVLFGHNPGIIFSRQAKFTYGIRSTVPFDPFTHPVQSKKMIGGKPFCVDAFKVLVRQGDEVATGHRISETKTPKSDDEKSITIELFLSTDPDPRFVSDATCSRIGNMYVRLPKGEKPEERAYEISFIFGEIEVMLTVRHLNSGESFTQYFNFM